jgi:Tfp pilus assembly protein PilO
VTRTNQILLAVAAAVAAAAAFYFLALSPKRDEIARLDGDIAAKQSELAQAQQQLATYEQARKSYKRNYATLARLGKAVPADDDVRSLLIQLESAADRTGVDFEKIELGSNLAGASGGPTDATAPTAGELASAPGAVEVAGGALSALPFNFSFTGGYFDLNRFFAKLEHFVTVKNNQLDSTGRLLRIESIAITPSTTGFPAMQAQVGAATYIVPPVQGVGEAAAPGSSQNATTPSSPSSTDDSTTTTATAGAAQ